MLRFFFSAAFGAALVYFLDPEKGRDRRAMASRRFVGILKRGSYPAENKARHLARYAQSGSQLEGRQTTTDDSSPNDPTLTQKVESEIFRDPSIPKGQININAENGVVVLRGQLDHPDQIRR